jgi:Holliday junction resolvasome RuvABC endonuclease subunit
MCGIALLAVIPQADAGDTLALAICHAHACRGVQVKPAKQI